MVYPSLLFLFSSSPIFPTVHWTALPRCPVGTLNLACLRPPSMESIPQSPGPVQSLDPCSHGLSLDLVWGFSPHIPTVVPPLSHVTPRTRALATTAYSTHFHSSVLCFCHSFHLECSFYSIWNAKSCSDTVSTMKFFFVLFWFFKISFWPKVIRLTIAVHSPSFSTRRLLAAVIIHVLPIFL